MLWVLLYVESNKEDMFNNKNIHKLNKAVMMISPGICILSYVLHLYSTAHCVTKTSTLIKKLKKESFCLKAYVLKYFIS